MVPQFENNFAPAFQIIDVQPIVVDELPDLGGLVGAPPPFHPAPSNRISQTDQELHVHIQWTVEGLLAQLLPNTCDWITRVYLEQYGQGEAIPGEYKTTTAHVQAFNNAYDVTVSIPANALDPGLYRLAVSITFEGPGGEPLPPAGFAEIGNLNVYESI